MVKENGIFKKVSNIFEKLHLTKKCKDTVMIPVLFNNTPISDEKYDIFNFKEQVNILGGAIKNGSALIGIIGDYGSGKSSLTEICQKILYRKYGQAIRINMWDTTERNNLEQGFNFLMRSFLYQLAQGNKRKNVNFAKYINERQSRNYGKLSLTMASQGALFWFLLAGLFLVLFFTLTNNDIFTLLISFISKYEMNTLLTFVNLIKIFSYPILFISIIHIYFGIKVGAFVFSLWDSQGKMNPEYGDIFDNYIHIINRFTRFSFSKRKKIIYVEDLDRINDKRLVILFLKELHRLINILPINQRNKVAFVISLKSESSLKRELLNNVPKDDKSIYSKIFDFTIWIKPIHYENISDVFWELLRQNQEPVKIILGLDKSKDLTKIILKDLEWLQIGENLTIREIKDRLNETFILYQTLKVRNPENSSVKLKKCCAVTYLHRTYPDEYEELLKREQVMAELIRDCCQWQKNDEKTITEKTAEIIGKELFKDVKNTNHCFTIDFAKMLFAADIDEDFMMYFYNYPISSYIKSLDEKDIFDYIIHPSNNFKADAHLSDKIDYVITQKKGRIIEKAIDELNEKELGMPDIIFENEQLFTFSLKYNEDFIMSTLEIYSRAATEKTNKICYLFEKILSYCIDEKLKKEIIESQIYELIFNTPRNNLNDILSFRVNLIKSVKSYIHYFHSLFVDDEMPIISKQELQLLDSPDEKLSLINDEFIDKRNNIYIFEEIQVLELNDNQYKKAETIISNIRDIEELPNIQRYLLVFLSKNKKYNDHFFTLILDNLGDNDKSSFCEYLNSIDLSLLTKEQLSKLDKMRLRNIYNENIVF